MEVVEIDGSPIESRPQAGSDPRQAHAPQWQKWTANVRSLPAFWWPLWLILGIIAAALLLTFGLVFILGYALFHILRRLVRTILG